MQLFQTGVADFPPSARILRDATYTNLLAFRAPTDGVTDATAAIVRALTEGRYAYAGPRVIDGGGLTYKIGAAGITLPENTFLKNCVFDCTTTPGGPGNNRLLDNVFVSTGTAGTAHALAADVARGAGPDPYVPVASALIASGYANGDLVMLKSNELWNAGSNVGEFIKVRRVDGDRVYLQHSTRYNYTVANAATITKVTPAKNVGFIGCTVKGPVSLTLASGTTPYLGFFEGLYTENVVFEGNDMRGWNRAAALLRWSWGNHVRYNYFADIIEYYGVLFANGSRFNWFEGNFGFNTRHMFSTGSSNTYGGGVLLDTWVNFNYASGRDASLDSHPGADGIIFQGNVVEGGGEVSAANGIFINSANSVVIGNVCKGYLNGGITVQPLFTNQDYAGTVEIRGNTIEVIGGSVSNVALNVSIGTNSGAVPKAIAITGNTVTGNPNQGIYVLNSSTALPIQQVNITGNNVTAVNPIQVRSNTAQGLEGGNITGNMLGAFTTGVVLRCDDAGGYVRGFAIMANTLRDGSTGVQFSGSAAFTDNEVEPNVFHNVTTPIHSSVRTHVIASGAITLRVNSGLILVDTEGAAATDDLVSILGGQPGKEITLRQVANTKDIVVTHGTALDGVRLVGGGTFTLGETRHNIKLACETGPRWSEVSRALPS